MKHWQRCCAVAAAVMLFFSLFTPLCASADGTLAGYLAAGRQLMLHTPNVTVTGEAEFRMDGEVFKKASGRCVRAGTDGYTRLELRTPRGDGTERATGFTVITQDDAVFAIEDFHPSDCHVHIAPTRESLMRETTQLDLLLDLCGSVLEQEEKSLAGKLLVADKEEGGEEIRLTLSGADLPPVADQTLNLLTRYALKRFFRIDWDDPVSWGSADIGDYVTVTEGVLYTMRSIAVDALEVTAALDREGRLTQLSGNASFVIRTCAQKEHLLRVIFRAEASDFGESSVTPFDAADYNVTLPEWFRSMYDPQPGADSIMEQYDGYSMNMISCARQIWAKAGYAAELNGSGTVYETPLSEQVVCRVTFCDEDGVPWLVNDFAHDRLPIGFADRSAPWQEDRSFNSRAYADNAALLARARADALPVLESLCPFLTGKMTDLKLLWEHTDGNQTWLCFRSEAVDAEFVVRVEPTWRIEMFSAQTNG